MIDEQVREKMSKVPRVFPLKYAKTGKPAPQQIILKSDDYTVFNSYGTNIVMQVYIGGVQVTFIDKEYWAISRMTNKFRCVFLGENTEQTLAKLDRGKYHWMSLN